MESTNSLSAAIYFSTEFADVDWHELKAVLAADRFDNGRSAQQLRLSFENSHSCCFAFAQQRIIGTARVLSDGVCNAYLVDVWTLSSFRRCGIAREMIQRLCSGLGGQHIYLQADDDNIEFYRRLGFKEQPSGMSMVIGRWLVNESVAGTAEDSPPISD
jgi:ribosomal protein S18 acetylase RimI-like enzyme